MTDTIQAALALWQEYQRRRIDDAFADPLRDPEFLARCAGITLTTAGIAEVFGVTRTLPIMAINRGLLKPTRRAGRALHFALAEAIRWRAERLYAVRTTTGASAETIRHIRRVAERVLTPRGEHEPYRYLPEKKNWRILIAVADWLDNPSSDLLSAIQDAIDVNESDLPDHPLAPGALGN